MQLALIRHPALRMPPGLCYGRLDFPLRDATDVARIVADLGNFVADIVWSSPAGRCQLLASSLPARTRHIEPDLRELDFGSWEGQRWDAIDRAAFDAWAADPVSRAPPGGEYGAALVSRVTRVFATIARAGQPTAVVTHGGPLKVLRALARRQPVDLLAPAPPPGSVDIVEVAHPGAN